MEESVMVGGHGCFAFHLKHSSSIVALRLLTILLCLAISALIFGGRKAHATLVEGGFQGTVELLSGPAVPNGIAVGDAVTGAFFYDTEGASDLAPGNATYGDYLFGPTNAFVSLTIGGFTWSSDGTDVQAIVANGSADFFEMVFRGGAGTSTFPGRNDAELGLLSWVVWDRIPAYTLFLSDGLPTDIDSSEITGAGGNAVLYSVSGDPIYDINFSIDQDTFMLGPPTIPVSEPSTLFLVGMGIVCFAGIRRKFKK